MSDAKTIAELRCVLGNAIGEALAYARSHSVAGHHDRWKEEQVQRLLKMLEAALDTTSALISQVHAEAMEEAAQMLCGFAFAIGMKDAEVELAHYAMSLWSKESREDRAEREAAERREAGMRRALEYVDRILKFEREHKRNDWTLAAEMVRTALGPAPETVFHGFNFVADPAMPPDRLEFRDDSGKVLGAITGIKPAPSTESGGERKLTPEKIRELMDEGREISAALRVDIQKMRQPEHGPEKRCRLQSNDVRDPMCRCCRERASAPEPVKQYPPNACRHWTDHLCRACGGLFQDCQGIHF